MTATPEDSNLAATNVQAASRHHSRVLHLVPSFTGGGAERQVGYLAKALADLGLDVHVGYLHGGPNLAFLKNTRVTLHRLEVGGNHDVRLPWIIHRLIRKIRPDVVQTWIQQMDVLGGLAARFDSVPWVLSERSSAAAYQTGWKSRLRKIIGRGATAIVANSRVGLDYWQDASTRTLRRTIRNILPLDAIAASSFSAQERSEIAIGGARLVIGAGRLHPEKNWPVLIEALNDVLAKRPDVHAVIFGEGALRDSLLRLISRSPHANRIHLKGYTHDLWKWLKLASCYVSVSPFEGSPNVLLEAIACELPLVVSDIPGHREVLSETAAEFVPSQSAAAVANAIGRVLDDGENMARRAHDTFQVVQQWSPAAIAGEYAALYREIARGNAASNPQTA